MVLQFERISWIGSMIIVLSALPSLFFFSSFGSNTQIAPPVKEPTLCEDFSKEIHFPLRSELTGLAIGVAEEQFAFSMDPTRPDREPYDRTQSHRFLIRLKESKQMKRMEMAPNSEAIRVGLSFHPAGYLQFSEDSSRFWLEFYWGIERQIKAFVKYRAPTEEIMTYREWTPVLMDTPLQTLEDFSQGSPFRELAASKWCGVDLLAKKIEGEKILHRIEIGASMQLIDCLLDDWLVFRSKTWEKCTLKELENIEAHQTFPVAHIVASSLQYLEVEGWEGESHVRFHINLSTPVAFKIKPEDLFSQLRVRSEKQVSCTMDKQCLVLRPGDWVFKSAGGRWKILRKFEEKKAFLTGNHAGEVFVLEKIGVAPSSKNIVGWYFSANRVQAVAIEMAQRSQKSRRANR